MTNDRPATAMDPGPPDDSTMDHARGQEATAGGLDLDPDEIIASGEHVIKAEHEEM